MFDVMTQATGIAIWAAVCAWAMARGGAPERLAGGIRMVSAVITPFVHFNVGYVELGIFTVDVVVLALFVFIALRWDRWWAIFAAAFLLCQALTHVARLFNLQVSNFYYATAAMFWSYASLWAMAFGVGQLEWKRWKDWRLRSQTA